jgi:predicted ABC-type ATPase
VKEIVLIGGPNGAGKTTASRVLLSEFFRLHEFLNADEIAREIAPENPESAALAAGRRMILEMRDLVRWGESFGLETTCAGKSYAGLLERCKSDGWRIRLLFFSLPSPEYAMSRVARRVNQGGHSIPTLDIRRRFYAGLLNMRNIYLPLAEDAEIYDNTDGRRILIAEKRAGGSLVVYDPDRWRRIEEIPNEQSTDVL